MKAWSERYTFSFSDPDGDGDWFEMFSNGHLIIGDKFNFK
jgi:hypothetical protein